MISVPHINILTNLRNKGAKGIKTSFEDEGAKLNNLQYLRRLTDKTNMSLTLKIGGPEAKTDTMLGMDIGVDGIVAPMIESDFAVKKFTNFSNSLDVYKGINVETIQGIENYHNMISSDSINYLDFMCIGRVDLVSSMKKDRSFVNSNHVNKMLIETFGITKENSNLKCYMGGALTLDSYDIIEKLYHKKLIDCVETRYIIFNVNDVFMNNYSESIKLAQLFEYEYLDYLYKRDEDYLQDIQKRKDMLIDRLNK